MASTLICHKYLEEKVKLSGLDPKTEINEGTITSIRSWLITNHYLGKVGEQSGFGSLIFMDNPDPRKYTPPHCVASLDTKSYLSCTGKHHADCIESLIGAIFISNGLPDTFKFMSNIGLLPLDQFELINGQTPKESFEFKGLHPDLEVYKFNLKDTITVIYQKYIEVCS